MAKELYLYSTIYDFVAADLIAQMEELQGEDITIRSNSPGGSVFAGWGIIAKMQEHTGKLKIKADGLVASMSLYMLLFCDDVEALDVTAFVLHRADMYVGDQEDQDFLNSVNDQLKAKLISKIDVAKLKELKGVTIKQIFSTEGDRLDVRLTAKEAQQIGLISKIKKMTPAVMAELKLINTRFNTLTPVAEDKSKPKTVTSKNNIMTIETLKAEHPAVYNAVFALGVEQEKDRVESCLIFNEVDPVAVKAAIEGGKPLTQKQMADFSLKAISKGSLTAIAKDGVEPIVTKEAEAKIKTEKEKLSADFEAALDAQLNIKK